MTLRAQPPLNKRVVKACELNIRIGIKFTTNFMLKSFLNNFSKYVNIIPKRIPDKTRPNKPKLT